MRSYVDFRTEQLTESIDYLDHRDALRTHLEILKLQLLEAAKLPSLFSENILDESEYNHFRAEDHRFNSKIIEAVINFAVANLYDEIVNEADAPIAPTGPTGDPKILLTQLKDSLIKKVRVLMHDLRNAVTSGIEAGRSEPDDAGAGATATATGAPTGGTTGPAGSSASTGAGSAGPSAGGAPTGAPSGGGAPMGGGPAAPTGHPGPGGRSPMDTRPDWGSPRGHSYEGGFRPADYGSFRPSDGWMAGLRRTVVDPLMNSRPIKWLRRKWHGDPQREGTTVLGKLFTENALVIAQKFADAEKDLIGWINQNVGDIAKQMGFDMGAVAGTPATGVAPATPEVEDGSPSPSVGMGEAPDGASMPELAHKAAQGDKPSKIKWEYMKDAIKDLGYQFTGEDKAGVHQRGEKRGQDKEGYVNLLHLIQNNKGTLVDQFERQSGPALRFLANQIYPKVFGKEAPHKGALGKLQEKLQCATGSTHHDVNALLQAYGKWLHHNGAAGPEAAAAGAPAGTEAAPAATPEAKPAAPAATPEAKPATPAAPATAAGETTPDAATQAKQQFKVIARANPRAAEIEKALGDPDTKAMVRNDLHSGMSAEDAVKKLLAHIDGQAATSAAPAPSVGMDENPPQAAPTATEPEKAVVPPAEPLQTATVEPAAAEEPPAPEDDIPMAPEAENEESEEDVMNNFSMDAEGLDIPRMVNLIKTTVGKYGRTIDARKLQALIDKNILQWQADPDMFPSAQDEEGVAKELGATLIGDAFREFQKSQYDASQAKGAKPSALPQGFKFETFRDKLNRFKRMINEERVPQKSPTQLLREHLSLN